MHPLAQPRVHQVSMDLPGMDSMMATKNVPWKVWWRIFVSTSLIMEGTYALES